ncbi:hydroxymethylbilane synthase [Microlunatus parietis]|uniref:Hydroxymethylbilane synthase n=1 Tax=Microlunatus parietis TaxID=682979 RepID=A0A7Y9IBF4_9ACTN|nr:hydroxymethylbilane synthase [Microlunatus parietis]NYE73204.1 hydroxymethylbilane synthase [Microlunatus parietis]
MKLRLGARTSPLSRAQADWVAARLAEHGVETEFVGITTKGDVDQRELTRIGGTGIFAAAVREALLDGTIDLAVHSLKDLPTLPEPGLRVAAVPVREDTRDVLVGLRLADLNEDGPTRVGTGAPRRAAQLIDYGRTSGQPIEAVPIRGNVGTRIELVRSGKVDAVVLAAAGLRRLGLLDPTGDQPLEVTGLPAELLAEEVMLPAPGQGALGLEVAESLAPDLAAAVAALNDPAAAVETRTERAFLARLEAGCTAPVGARAKVKSVHGKRHDLTLTAVVGGSLGSNPPRSIGDNTASIGEGSVLRVETDGSVDDSFDAPLRFATEAADRALIELRRTAQDSARQARRG